MTPEETIATPPLGADPGGDRAVPRAILRGSAWIFAGKVLSSALGLTINALLAHLLSPRQLGAYFLAFSLVLVGSTIGTFGLDLTAVRFVSSALGVGRPDEAGRTLRTVFGYAGIAASVVALVTAVGLGPWLVRSVSHSPVLADAMPIVAGWLFAVALQSIVVATFRAFQTFGFSTLFDQVLMDVMAAATFATLLQLNAHLSLAAALGITGGITAFVSAAGGGVLWLRARRLRAAPREDALPVPSSRRDLFHAAWPLMLTNLSVFLIGSGVDVWILSAFRSGSTVALYGGAVRLVLLVGTPALVTAGAIAPTIARLHAQGRTSELQRHVRVFATLAAVPSALMLLMFVVIGRPILSVFYGHFYGRAHGLLVALSVGRLVGVATGACGMVLVMTGHGRTLMHISLVTGALSVAAGLAVTPHFGAAGIAVATSAAVAGNNLAQHLAARRLAGVWTHVELSPAAVVRYLRANLRSRGSG